MKKILITGGAGFLGRHFFHKLSLNPNYQIILVDNYCSSGGAIEMNLESKNNILYKKNCEEYFKENTATHFNIVIHLAGLIGGREFIESQQIQLAQNLSTDYELFNWAKITKPDHLICFSSSAVYPVTLQEKLNAKALTEADFDSYNPVGRPDQTYGWCKMNLEYLAKVYHLTTGLKCSVYRPFSGYGSGQSLKYPISNLCQLALKLKNFDSFPVWGSGLQTRDFIHVSDIVDAVLSTYQSASNSLPINLCTGIETSFIDVVNCIQTILNTDLKISTHLNKPTGVERRFGDNSKLIELGYRPKINLKQGLELVISSLKKELSKT